MTQDRDRLQVTFLGETFTIKGETNHEEIEKTSRFLNEQFNDLKARCPSLSHKNLAILAAFNLAMDMLRLRKDYEDLVEILDK